ncbi:hypothetical protein SASPL_104825 [Salvia splendens]|uniref:Protein ARV n=1 Tax=Salvia splendens TaxID=180675 RepID=A0A8X9A823_SALSN|nr:hypothetical protein SASPL_104825 [Salvia splendens]
MASRVTTSEEERTTTDFRCVRCGFPVKTLYIQYSPGNIRLVKCGNCKAVADGYIECEVMILILDLILHKPKAYRHVFYNMFSKETVNFESLLWKLVLVYGMLDISALDKMWVLSTNEKEYTMPANIDFTLYFVGGCSQMLTGVMWKHMLFVVVVSSYFKLFVLAMMVWEFPSSVIVIIDVFVLSSNTVALKGGIHRHYRLFANSLIYLEIMPVSEMIMPLFHQSEQSVRSAKLIDRNGMASTMKSSSSLVFPSINFPSLSLSCAAVLVDPGLKPVACVL